MPFDDTSHERDDGDDNRKHRNMDKFVNDLIASVYMSCKLNSKCVPCAMWSLGTHLLSKWIALRCKRHVDKHGYHGHEAIGEMVATEVAKIMDVLVRDAVKYTVQECQDEIRAYVGEPKHE